jgi:LysR family glycine cleavage system transcriptional activator
MVPKLPPLNAVKAFEAIARCGGFGAAARELGVTPAAVSQQIKNLEDFFGTKLLARHNKRLQLTDAGLAIYTESTEIMERLAEMTRRMLEEDVRTRFVISTLHSPGMRWLNRQIPDFLRAEPDIRCEFRIEPDPVDFARHHIDLRICYGNHLYPELVTIPLVHDRVTPLCTPQWAQARDLADKGIDGLRDEDLIHTVWSEGYTSTPGWADWFERAGRPRQPRLELGHKVELPSLAVDFALAGMGVALGQILLARDEIADGRLLTPFAPALSLGYPYCAVASPAKHSKRSVSAFIDWIKQRV